MSDDILTRLVIEPDDASVRKALRAVEQLEKGLATSSKAAASAAREMDTLSKRTGGIETSAKKFTAVTREAVQTEKAVTSLRSELNTLSAAAGDIDTVTTKFDALTQSIEKSSAAARGVDVGEAAGRTSTGLGSIAAVTSAVPGLGAGTEGLRIVGDIAGAAEQLPRLGQGIADFGRAAASSSGFIGQLSSGLSALVPGLGAAGAGIASLGLSAGVLVAAALPAALAIKSITDRYREQREAAEAAAASLARVGQETADVQQRLIEGNINAAIDLQAQKQRELTTLLLQQQPLLERQTQLQAALNEARALEADLAAEVSEGGIRNQQRYDEIQARLNELGSSRELRTNLDALNERLFEMQTAAFDVGQAIEANNTALAAYGVTQDQINARIQQQIDSERASADASVESAQATEQAAQEETELARARERASQVLDQLAEQETSLRENAAQREAELAEDRALAQARAAEDLKRQLIRQAEDQANRLKDIEASSAKAIETLRKDAANREAELTARNNEIINQANADAAKRIGEANRAFFADQVAQTVKFRAEESRRTASFNKQRVRDLEDLHHQLLDAERANDVTAFIQAQRAANIKLKRNQEDFDEETRLRQDAFETQQAEARAALEQTIANIRAETQTKIAEQRAAFEQEREQLRAQTEERAAAMRAETQARLDAERTAFEERQALEAEERARREQRAAEDQALADRRRQNQLNAQLADIQRRRDAELQALAQVEAAARRVGQVAAGIAPGRSAAPQSQTQQPLSPLRRIPGRGGGGGAFTFQEGGVFTRPFAGFITAAEREPEAIIPLSRLADIAAQAFAPNIAVHMGGVHVGEYVSSEHLQRQLAALDTQIKTSLLQAFEIARHRPILT